MLVHSQCSSRTTAAASKLRSHISPARLYRRHRYLERWCSILGTCFSDGVMVCLPVLFSTIPEALIPLPLIADILLSTLHRVTLPPLSDRFSGPSRLTRARYSIPYFVAPDPDSVVECFQSCTDEGRPAMYDSVMQREYGGKRARLHYEDGPKG